MSSKKAFLRAGLPLVGLLVGGSVLLSVFMQTHMEIKDKKYQSTSKRKFDLEQEHAEMMKKLDIDNYTLSRIPRPPGVQDKPKDKK